VTIRRLILLALLQSETCPIGPKACPQSSTAPAANANISTVLVDNSQFTQPWIATWHYSNGRTFADSIPVLSKHCEVLDTTVVADSAYLALTEVIGRYYFPMDSTPWFKRHTSQHQVVQFTPRPTGLIPNIVHYSYPGPCA